MCICNVYVVMIFLGRGKVEETEHYIVPQFGAKAESS